MITYAIVFDKMNKEQQMDLIHELITNNIHEETIDDDLREMLIDSGVVQFNGKQIISYWDLYSDEYHIKSSNGFERSSPIEKEGNIKEFNKKHKSVLSSNRPLLFGYIEIFFKKNNSMFKMANKESLNNNKRNSIIGTVCEQTSQITNSKMNVYLSDIDLNVKGKPKKVDLCTLYEYGLRSKRTNFLRPRFFIQYKKLLKIDL
jgi:hypothetical protein